MEGHTLQTPRTWDRCPVSAGGGGGLSQLLINPTLLGNSWLYLVKASWASHPATVVPAALTPWSGRAPSGDYRKDEGTFPRPPQHTRVAHRANADSRGSMRSTCIALGEAT